jgi:hypothetical protein
MGTRSLTRVIEVWKDDSGKQKTEKLVTMYRQYDGYPSGHGQELAEFITGGKVVNGLGVDNNEKVFNGAGCFAAQMISHFKGDSAGGFYIYSNSAKDVGEEYEYHVLVDFNTKQITLKCYEVGFMKKDGKYSKGKKLLFNGDAKNFEELVTKLEQENT